MKDECQREMPEKAHQQMAFDQIIEDYRAHVEFARDVVRSINGRRVTDDLLNEAQGLAYKLLFHASSIYQLAQGTNLPLKTSGQYVKVFDFASVAALARVAIETYAILHELYMIPTSDDERQFNLAVFRLSGITLLEGWKPSAEPLQSAHEELAKKAQALRSEIEATEKFKTLKKEQKVKVLAGKRLTNWNYMIINAGFSSDFIHHLYALENSYVHADKSSAIQFGLHGTEQGQQQAMLTHIITARIALCKLVLDYVSRFDEAKVIAATNHELFEEIKLEVKIFG